MKRLVILAFAAVALLATATTMLWSRSPSVDGLVGSTGMTLQELYAAVDVNKLPTDDFEDMSLVYSNNTKR